MAIRLRVSWNGSSPRMRGTPATARRSRTGRTVHPRACGEHAKAIDKPIERVGSSPRMRGTRNVSSTGRVCGRFIPAHAGNTRNQNGPGSICSVHPRACGEHWLGSLLGCSAGGSSPRMRGTRQTRPGGPACRRFIPAHAGNTIVTNILRHITAVHPRACGEHYFLSRTLGGKNGSSPRMRGTLIVFAAINLIVRFIPAHAGNTRSRMASWMIVTVHPRACGEHLARQRWPGPLFGSSPRMRGTLLEDGPGHCLRRFIPAHAGNTCPRRHCRAAQAVHPRACGEHSPSRR